MRRGAASALEAATLTTRQRAVAGYTYLGVLFIVSVLAMTAAAASVVWHIAQERDDERELVFIGRQFEAAIDRYHAHAVDPAQPYPRRLEDLLRDDRSIVPQHHLRRLYVDPMTGEAHWGLLRLPDGGIVGVHSLSDRRPYPRLNVVPGYTPPVSTSYQTWKFVAPSAAEAWAAVSATQGTTTAPPMQGAVARSNRQDRGEVVPAAEPEAAVEPATPRAPRPTQEDLRTRTPEACARITAYDEQSCQQLAGSAGDEAARVCRDSALQRAVACTLGTSVGLPPLLRGTP